MLKYYGKNISMLEHLEVFSLLYSGAIDLISSNLKLIVENKL